MIYRSSLFCTSLADCPRTPLIPFHWHRLYWK